MIPVKTYQDLLEASARGSEADVIAFITGAINDHKGSALYKTAVDAQMYFYGENPTINRYEKVYYNMQGLPEKDMYTANHKIASNFFGFNVKQAVNYLLGNGITFKKSDTLKRLGPKFYEKTKKTLTNSQIGGVAFGFWNLDHMDIFSAEEFAPLYDEDNGALAAGIRFWQLSPDKPLRATLYEPDGFTEYVQRKDASMTILSAKRPYKIHVTETELDSTKIYDGENYSSFPIVPMKNNDKCYSELHGKQNTVDAFDLCTSNMVNNADDNMLYWILTNCCGMDMNDAQKFIDTVKKTHVAFAENGDDGSRAEPHVIDAPYEGIQATIDMLEKRLYQDFQAFDASAVTAGNQTATAIKASYVPLDLKADDMETNLTEFIKGILELAGIDDEPAYTRNKLINSLEEMQTLMMAAPYADDEYITTKALTIMGDADMVDEVLDRKAADDLGRFDGASGEREDNADGENGN